MLRAPPIRPAVGARREDRRWNHRPWPKCSGDGTTRLAATSASITRHSKQFAPPQPSLVPTFTCRFGRQSTHLRGSHRPGHSLLGLQRRRSARRPRRPTHRNSRRRLTHLRARHRPNHQMLGRSNNDGQLDAPEGQHTAIAAGGSHTCALDTDQNHQNAGAITATDRANAPIGQHTVDYRRQTSTPAHSASTRPSDCWGWNGNRETEHPGGRYTQIDAGGSHTCALDTDQAISCWGWNTFGRLDAPPGPFAVVVAGGEHSCGLRTDQSIACWGSNSDGQATPPTGQFAAIAAGRLNSCAIRTDKTLQCWGKSSSDQIKVSDDRFLAVDAGRWHTCGLRNNHRIECWGLHASESATSPTWYFKHGFKWGWALVWADAQPAHRMLGTQHQRGDRCPCSTIRPGSSGLLV